MDGHNIDSTIKIGAKVNILYSRTVNTDKPDTTGIIEQIYDAGVTVSEEDIIKYWKIPPGDKRFEKFQGPLKILRVVIKKADGTYLVAPEAAFKGESRYAFVEVVRKR